MKKNGWKGFCKKLYKYRVFLLMLAPAVIYTLIFSYYPMTGIVMAFKKYSYAGGIWGSPWNGFDNFKFFFKSGQAGLVTRNTVLYNLAFIAINTTMQIAVAVLLTEIRNKHYRKITQSLMFLPYFISWVIVGVMAFNIFSSDYGFLNRLIETFGLSLSSLMYGRESDTVLLCTWQQLWELTLRFMKQPASTEQTCSSEFSK